MWRWKIYTQFTPKSTNNPNPPQKLLITPLMGSILICDLNFMRKLYHNHKKNLLKIAVCRNYFEASFQLEIFQLHKFNEKSTQNLP